MKESGDLGIDVLNGLCLTLIGLQDFQELLVNFWLLSKPILPQISTKRSRATVD